MKIGILGSGKVALTLARAWAEKGHTIYIGARNPQNQKLATLIQHNPSIQAGSLADAAAFGDSILLAINPWTEIEGVIKPLQEILQDKLLIDVSNNINFGDKPGLAFSDKSMGEYIQALLPHTSVVKTLNITPAAMMVNPHQSGISPAISWVSGNNADANQAVSELVKDLGWDEVIDIGNIHSSMLQENIGLILTVIITSLSK